MAIDRREVSWKNLEVRIGTNILCSLQSFDWKRTKDLELFFGKGDIAQTVVEGNIENTCEIMISERDYVKLLHAAPDGQMGEGKSILNIPPVDIMGSYTNPAEGSNLHFVRAEGVRFKEEGTTVAQGDKTVIYTIPGLACVIYQDPARTGVVPDPFTLASLTAETQ